MTVREKLISASSTHRFCKALAAADANADQQLDSLDVAAIQRRTDLIPETIGNLLLVIDPSAITIATSDVLHNILIRLRGDVKR